MLIIKCLYSFFFLEYVILPYFLPLSERKEFFCGILYCTTFVNYSYLFFRQLLGIFLQLFFFTSNSTLNFLYIFCRR